MGLMDAIRTGVGDIKSYFSPKPSDMFQNKTETGIDMKGSGHFNEDLVAYTKKIFEKAQKDRKPVELQWLLTMNFLQNNQYCDINLFSNSVKQIGKRYEWESREIFNKMAPIYEARIAQLTASQPSPFVRPTTGEPDDQASARVSASVARDIESYNAVKEMRLAAIAWAEICGNCFIKSVWDPNAGDIIGEDANGYVRNGYVKKVLVPAFEAFPVSTFTPGIENQKQFIHAKAFPVAEVNEQWGCNLSGRNVNIFSLSLSGIGTGGLGMNLISPMVMKTEMEDYVVVVEMITLPCKKFPKGSVIVICEDELLEFKEMTYLVGERNEPSLPYEHYQCISNPTTFWADSVLYRLIPVQRAYNAVRNRKHEALNRKAIGVLTMQDDGEIDVEDMEQQGIYPGKIIIYGRTAQKPEFLNGGPSTQDFDNEERMLETMFETISGVSPFASHGATPAGMVSGSAIEKLKEQDTARSGLTINNINSAAIRGFKIGLRICKQFAQGPRIMRLIGKNEEIAVGYWMASQLTSDDVIIDKEDSLNQTSAERKEQLTKLLQYGLFDKVTDPRIVVQVLRIMEMGDWENSDSMQKLHISKALRENELIKQGAVPVAKQYDDHILHKEEHDKMRLTSEWEAMIAQNPQIEMAADQHSQIHDQFTQQTQQMAMQQAAQQQQISNIQKATGTG